MEVFTSPAYVSMAEAGSLLGVSWKTVQRLAKSDPTFPARIDVTGGSRLIRFSRAAVLTWASAHGTPTADAPAGEAVANVG